MKNIINKIRKATLPILVAATIYGCNSESNDLVDKDSYHDMNVLLNERIEIMDEKIEIHGELKSTYEKIISNYESMLNEKDSIILYKDNIINTYKEQIEIIQCSERI